MRYVGGDVVHRVSATTTGVNVFYSGDSQNAGSGSSIAYLTTPPTLTVTLTGTNPSVNTSSTVNGSVKFGTTQTIPPSGFVTISTLLFSGTTPTVVATVPAASAYAGSGIAFTFTAPSTPGAYYVYASYAGDPNYPAFTSANSTLSVNAPIALATTLTVTNPATATVNAVFSVNIKLASATSTQTPSGTINVVAKLAGSTSSTNIGIVNANQAYATTGNSFNANFPTAGVWTITASFYGDPNFAPSTGSATITINPATAVATTLKITAPASVAVNTPYTALVNLTAASTLTNGPSGLVALTVTSPAGATVATINTTAASAFLNGTGYTASIPAATAPGTYTLTATYAGDTNYSASSITSTITVTGGAIGTTLTLTAPATAVLNSTYNAVVKLTPAMTSSPAPTGNVILTSSTTGYPTVTIATITAPQALAAGGYTVNIPANVAATSVLTAAYAGDTNYSASTPVSSTVTVTGLPDTLAVSISGTTALGQAFPIQVQLQNLSSYTPTGTITLTYTLTSGSPMALATVSAAAAAASGGTTVMYTANVTGAYVITATYPGDTHYAPASGLAAFGITTSAPGITISGPATGLTPANLTFNIDLVSSSASSLPPTGNITLSSTRGTVAGPSATLTAVSAEPNGSLAGALATLVFTTPGSYTLIASYPGDANYPAATSNTITVTITDSTAPRFTAVLTDMSPEVFSSTTPRISTRSILYTALGGFNTPVTLSYTDDSDQLGKAAADFVVTFSDAATGLPVTTFTPSANGTNIIVTVDYIGDYQYSLLSPPLGKRNSLYTAGGLLFFSFLGYKKRNSRRMLQLLGICLVITCGTVLTACGGDKSLLTVIATPTSATQNGTPQSVAIEIDYVNGSAK